MQCKPGRILLAILPWGVAAVLLCCTFGREIATEADRIERDLKSRFAPSPPPPPPPREVAIDPSELVGV
jgi:hypothetical protein